MTLLDIICKLKTDMTAYQVAGYDKAYVFVEDLLARTFRDYLIAPRGALAWRVNRKGVAGIRFTSALSGVHYSIDRGHGMFSVCARRPDLSNEEAMRCELALAGALKREAEIVIGNTETYVRLL